MSQWININDRLPEPLIDVRVKLTDESEFEGYSICFIIKPKNIIFVSIMKHYNPTNNKIT
jgi:hypothetical protein